MNTSTAIVTQSADLVRRARAGDQNAMALIMKVGDAARGGKNQRASQAFASIKNFIDQNPAQPFQLGAEPALLADPPMGDSSTALAVVPKKPVSIEQSKPPIPRGLFDRLFDAESFPFVVVRACQYRNGLDAAAVVLAAGPLLSNPIVREIGTSQFGSEESTAVFFHGVRFSSEDAWTEIAPQLDATLKRCLAIGQCVGRARKIQAVRMPNSRIGEYSEVAGWELGE